MHRKNDIMDERQVLASFISRLPEAIIICDAGGTILLHDSQSETYLQTAPANSSAVPVSMNGNPIASYINKNLIEHALDEIIDQLKQSLTPGVSSFVLQKAGRILHAQLAPVLTPTKRFSGFVFILEDITRQSQADKRVETLLKTLSKNARSPISSIRAAIEAMRQFPGMEEKKQAQFKEIIYKEAIVLSDMLNSLSDEYTTLIHSQKSLKRLYLKNLLQTVSRRSREKLGIFFTITPNPSLDDLKIKADPFLMITLLLFVLGRLKERTGHSEYGVSLLAENQVVQMDIAWKGDPVSPQLVREWESLDITSEGRIHMSLKEALNNHQSAMGTFSGSETEEGMPAIRFFIPLDKSLASEAFEPVSALPETRIQIGDMALFTHSDKTLELDNRLLTELSYTSLIREINQAEQVEEIIGKQSQLPRIIHSMLTSGTKIRTVTWLVTAFSDAILTKLLFFATQSLGPPPVPFAFVTLGSEGRKEQTLKTDQDNAIIFTDPADGQTLQTLQPYFLDLGEKVCTWLDRAGFDFCQGNIMAKNPKWCQPLSVWKTYFTSWIHAASPQDLLHATIFFDFRFAYGDPTITDALAEHLFPTLSTWTGFFRNMAQNAVYFTPPIGFFGNFLVNAKGPHKNCLDIKMATTPIVDFARIYSLKQGIRETSTQERLYQLYIREILAKDEYNELEQAYSFMMQLRFMVQIGAIIDRNVKPDNYVNPKNLSSMEKRVLKEALKKIKEVQTKLGFDFIGATDQQIS